ncbi:aldose 1-epimerase [Phenylobacterium montanum]|uniref:aldose 1-epimerase n=1 Tax=Phenylobacterium montanum TaxID=2823693 RepID=UPI0020132641|nr:aldose 1-epimerase [Caulobacter sp. S6]
MLRAAGADPGPLDLASFPLVPYANRIAHGVFSFGGRDVRLPGNLAGHQHPLHGHGWLSAWTVEVAAADRAVLAFDYPGGDWPWSYRAVQTIALTDEGLELTLALTNLAEEPAPAALGFHPYFPHRSRATLTTEVSGAWAIDEACLPVGEAPGPPMADWRSGAPLAQAGLIDHCHVGWRGPARIDLGEGLVVTLSASPNLGWLHLYSPPGHDFFCVEPVSCRPDALNAENPAAQGIATLPPGEALAASMSINVAVT